jgi:hypothetical protein
MDQFRKVYFLEPGSLSTTGEYTLGGIPLMTSNIPLERLARALMFARCGLLLLFREVPSVLRSRLVYFFCFDLLCWDSLSFDDFRDLFLDLDFLKASGPSILLCLSTPPT